ncbi:MAG TPA: hypothetical protein DDW50_11250 [Firmicutes bacterium]|nr:hypothetical protein [Bacillota bacterium]
MYISIDIFLFATASSIYNVIFTYPKYNCKGENFINSLKFLELNPRAGIFVKGSEKIIRE